MSDKLKVLDSSGNISYLQVLSERCAKRYRNTSHKDDLVSVGVLAALEELKVDPELNRLDCGRSSVQRSGSTLT